MTGEEKEFMTFEEAASYVGIKRATLYNYVGKLGIKPHKFNLDRRSYLALADVKKVKEIKDKPWTAGERPEEEAA